MCVYKLNINLNSLFNSIHLHVCSRYSIDMIILHALFDIFKRNYKLYVNQTDDVLLIKRVDFSC